MRHRADNNQDEIIDAIRAIGATVQILSQVGSGCPDILIGYHGINILIEIKQLGESLRPNQQIWHNAWAGQSATVHNIDEAIGVINATIRKGRSC